MNNTFNINRFGLLLKRQWLDFGKIYLISLVVLLGILVGFYSYSIPSPLKNNNFDYDGDLDMRFRYPLFLILGFVFISIVASSYFNILGQKSRAILELMTPASTFEKFLGGIFYTAILSLATYLILFYLVDLPFVKYINAHLSEFKMSGAKASLPKPVESISAQIVNDENYRNYLLHFITVPFLITSIFLVGSIYFNRFHYIKTAISVMVFGVLWVTSTIFVMRRLTSNTVWVGNYYWQDESNILFIMSLMGILLTLAFWLISFIRLKEKEA